MTLTKRLPPEMNIRELVFLSDVPKKPVFLSGLTELAKDAIIRLRAANIEVKAFVDSEHSGSWFGLPVIPYESLKPKDLRSNTLILCDEGLGHVEKHLQRFDPSRILDWGPALQYVRQHFLAIVDGRNLDPIDYPARYGMEEYDSSFNDAIKVARHLSEQTAQRLGDRYFVNVGCNDCKTHDPCYPFLQEGYAGLEIDLRPQGSELHQRAVENTREFPNAHLAFGQAVLPENICSIMKNADVPKDLALLKIDIDSWDFSILCSVLDDGYTPGIVQIEVNTCFPAGVDFAVEPQRQGDQIVFPRSLSADASGRMSGFHGVSLNLVHKYLRNRGYALVGGDFGYPDFPDGQRDAVFVLEDICREAGLPTYSTKVVLDREPLGFTHFHGDHGVDTNRWRLAKNPKKYETEIRDTISKAIATDYDGDASFTLEFE